MKDRAQKVAQIGRAQQACHLLLENTKVFVRGFGICVILTIENLREAEDNGEEKMPVKIMEANLANFGQVWETFKADAPNNKVNLLLFLADKEPSTGLSWCPDCVRAEPVIYKKVESSEMGIGLLRAYVGDRPTWRTPNHPWRVDRNFQLKGVPTLIRWENDAVKARLEDHEAHREAKIDALLSA
ncbi:hypothetical protein V2J09_008604 [Rumex salicifolius]